MAKLTKEYDNVKFDGDSIWGYSSVKGVGKTSVIDGKMNAQKYKQILQEN